MSTSRPLTRTRSSTKFPLLSLTPELLDLILSFLAPRPTKSSTLQLSKLLLLHPSLTPLVRRRLFHRITFVIGDKNGRDSKFLHLLQHEDNGGSGVGIHVRRLLVRAPDAMEVEGADLEPGLDLAAAMVVPKTKTPQVEAVRMLVDLLGRTKGLLRWEVETRLGTREEESNLSEEQEEEEERERASLSATMRSLVSLKEFGMAVSHLHLRLQIFSTPSWTSPYISALQSWSHLTALDLWRIAFHLPPATPPPTFSLRILNIVSSQLGSTGDLLWFLGEKGGARSKSLQVFKFKDVDFVSEGSSALLQVFPVDGTTPSFAATLRKLEITSYEPIGESEDAAEGALTQLTALQSVELSGQGITPSFFCSLAHSSSTLTHLELWYLPSLPLSLITHLLSNYFPQLKVLNIHLFRGLQRSDPLLWGESQDLEWVITSKEWREMRKIARRKEVTLKENGREIDVEESSASEDEEEEEEEVDGDALFEPNSELEGNEWVFTKLGESDEEEGSDFE